MYNVLNNCNEISSDEGDIVLSLQEVQPVQSIVSLRQGKSALLRMREGGVKQTRSAAERPLVQKNVTFGLLRSS